MRFLRNSAGTITDTYTFDAFGAQIASTGTTPNPCLYSGEQFDSALNLYLREVGADSRLACQRMKVSLSWARPCSSFSVGRPSRMRLAKTSGRAE